MQRILPLPVIYSYPIIKHSIVRSSAASHFIYLLNMYYTYMWFCQSASMNLYSSVSGSSGINTSKRIGCKQKQCIMMLGNMYLYNMLYPIYTVNYYTSTLSCFVFHIFITISKN